MIKHCRACRSSQIMFHGLTTCSSHGVAQDANLRRQLLKCKSCGSIIASPRPSNHDLEEYYANYSKDFNYFPSRLGWEKRLVYRTILDICKEINEGKILDAGCANGELLSMLPSSFQKYGVDISERNRDLARKKGITFLYASLDSKIISNRFDLIIALDFIEHVDSPKEIINVISELLATGGYVIIETGNADSFFAKYLKEDWSYTAVYGHLCVLTPPTLSQLAAEADINEVSINTGWHDSPL